MNKFGTRDIPKLIRELRFQERRHRVFDEERLADLLRDAADSLYGRGKRTNMTDPATIASLADRIEKLTGPDREVDAEIALALGIVPEGAFRPCAAIDAGTFATGAYGFWSCEPYTKSIDAALTLVPEGWWLAGLNYCPSDFRSAQDREWHAEIAGPVTWAVIDREVGEEPQFDCEGGNAATPALALTAACIRALATLQDGGEG